MKKLSLIIESLTLGMFAFSACIQFRQGEVTLSGLFLTISLTALLEIFWELGQFKLLIPAFVSVYSTLLLLNLFVFKTSVVLSFILLVLLGQGTSLTFRYRKQEADCKREQEQEKAEKQVKK